MAFCPSCCSDDARTVRATIPATQLGLPSGSLVGVEVTNCEECGEESISIPAHGAVIKEYRKQLAQINRALNSEEFSYLRRSLGVTGKGYAEALGISNVTISRVENGNGVPALQDALARSLTFLDIELSDIGAIEKLVSRQGSQVEVNVEAVEKSRSVDVLGGWMHIHADRNFSGNVVPIRRLPVVKKQIDYFEFESPVEHAAFGYR